MIDDGLEPLSEEESFRLLGSTGFGRIGISLGAMPVILPVNFALHGADIVFRTGEGTKLRGAVEDTVVAFQADQVYPVRREGWSVLVVGRASEVKGRDLEALGRATGTPWAPGERGHVARIRAEVVSGRRLRNLGGCPGSDG